MKWQLEEKNSGTKCELTEADASSQMVYEFGGRMMVINGHQSSTAYVGMRKNLVQVWLNGRVFEFSVTSPQSQIRKLLTRGSGATGGDALVAKMPGKVLRVDVKPGDAVKPNQTLLVLEAMKMENHLHIAYATAVEEVKVKPNDVVEAGQTLITFKKL